MLQGEFIILRAALLSVVDEFVDMLSGIVREGDNLIGRCQKLHDLCAGPLRYVLPVKPLLVFQNLLSAELQHESVCNLALAGQLTFGEHLVGLDE